MCGERGLRSGLRLAGVSGQQHGKWGIPGQSRLDVIDRNIFFLPVRAAIRQIPAATTCSARNRCDQKGILKLFRREYSMAAVPQSLSARPRWAGSPFYFNSASHLLRIGREKATNLQELLEAIRTCVDASIFQHTFQTLEEHHFIREGFSNDFSHWAFAACNEVGLAERLAAIDIREFTSIAVLRERLVPIIDGYLQKNPRAATPTAMEPFYLMAAPFVALPPPHGAPTLAEFADAPRQLTIRP